MRVQIDYRAFPEAVIAARYHHRLVSIQPFPNGNGRHARFMADLLLKELTGKIFTWGQNSLGSGGRRARPTLRRCKRRTVATTVRCSFLGNHIGLNVCRLRAIKRRR